MTSRRRLLLIGALAATLAAAAVGWFYWAPTRVPAGQPALTGLTTNNLRQLQADFNRAADSVRLLVLVSPT